MRVKSQIHHSVERNFFGDITSQLTMSSEWIDDFDETDEPQQQETTSVKRKKVLLKVTLCTEANEAKRVKVSENVQNGGQVRTESETERKQRLEIEGIEKAIRSF